MTVERLARTNRLFLRKSECHTLCRINNLMDEVYNFRDKYLKEYPEEHKYVNTQRSKIASYSIQI